MKLKNKKIKIAFIVVLMICFGITSGWVWARVNQNTFAIASLKTPDIFVEKQEGSPILISSAYAESNALKPSYGYSITNVSNKTIRAYAIQSEVFFGSENAKESGVDLVHLIRQPQLLTPNESRQKTGGNRSTYSQEVNKIVLSVDYVEFDDGTSWGANYYKSDEYILGQRAGATAAIDGFRKKLQTGGFEALSKEIDQDSINFALQADESKSDRWKSGFQSGIGFIRNRVKEALNSSGKEGVEQGLQRSFDISERRQEK